ncbi:DUF6161 domain-containing protein [Microvirga zambiensis]|uniref:DUF6161 domain-containing protein n=1 Tax=Microvirga zambiensis TaxID=1402137 RepID=UPI00191E4E9C|nr:DUF6161 domain-containing protein [Microvirga zambiensis]
MNEALEGLFAADFAVKTEAEAEKVIQEQRNHWMSLLQIVRNSLNSLGSEQYAVSALDTLYNQLPTLVGLFQRPHDIDRGFVISGRIPLLMRYGTALEEFARNHPHRMLGAILAEAGDGLSDILIQAQYPSDRLPHLFSPRVQAAATQYSIEKHDEALRTKISGEVEQGLRVHASIVSDNIKITNRTIREFEEKSAQLFERFNSLGAEQQRILEALQEKHRTGMETASHQWSAMMQQAHQDIDAAKALAFEAATFKGAREIWVGKKRKHSWTFGIGLTVLAIVIASAIGVLLSNWHTVLASVPRNTQGEFQASFLVFIVVPVVAAAWVLRIFARWVTNALTLGEDAEQRRAMLETYFSLVGNKDAKMEPSDRILILNAIFRPLPGHQSEDVAPPTLLDLTKEALSTKKVG